jgi:hypothetical protein
MKLFKSLLRGRRAQEPATVVVEHNVQPAQDAATPAAESSAAAKPVAQLGEPSLAMAPTLKLLALGEETEKRALPPLPVDLQRLLLTHLSDDGLVRLGAVSRSFYLLTRHDRTVWPGRIEALAKTLLDKPKGPNVVNREKLRQCANGEAKVGGFVGFLMLRSLEMYCDSARICTALYTFEPGDASELLLTEGKKVRIVEDDAGGWWFAQDIESGATGLVPSNYLDTGGEERSSVDNLAALRLQVLLWGEETKK